MDEQRYSELLAATRPSVINTPEEHERLLTAAEELMDKGEALAPEERKLLELLVLLIGVFEDEIEAAEENDEESENVTPPLPHETLQRLMQSRDWEPAVLIDVFGNPHIVEQVMSGKRPISKGQAKALARLFRVPEKLFIAS